MANCHDLFQKFYGKISISTTQRATLQKSRDAIRSRIRKHFKEELKVSVPKFFQQGSFALKTVVTPLNGEYDLDDGVYLQHLENNRSDWPATETVHSQVFKAIENHTGQDAKDKKNCVRVIYAGDHHIDLPIYCFSNNDLYFARKGEDQWIQSDPKAFSDWFLKTINGSGEQMRSSVKYIKAWNDFKNGDLTGIIITILVGQNHVGSENRDDLSLLYTVEKIIQRLKSERKVYNPVDYSENLLSGWSDSKIDRTIESIERFTGKAKEANETTDKEIASKKWVSVFGDRFPIYDKKDDKTATKEAGVVAIKSPSDPWGVNE
jgi:hypothetical protein